MEKPVIEFDSTGPSGNIFYILGLVRTVLRKQRRIIDYNNCWKRVINSHSYNEALEIIKEYVDLVDIGGEVLNETI